MFDRGESVLDTQRPKINLHKQKVIPEEKEPINLNLASPDPVRRKNLMAEALGEADTSEMYSPLMNTKMLKAQDFLPDGTMDLLTPTSKFKMNTTMQKSGRKRQQFTGSIEDIPANENKRVLFEKINEVNLAE